MQINKTLKYSLIAGWFIMGLAIFSIAILIIPEQSRSEYFWYRLIWSEALNILLWGSTSLYLLVTNVQKDSLKRYGGIAPTISIVTAFYALLSFVIMIVFAWMPVNNTLSRIHWILQILLLTATAITLVFLSMSRASAASDFESNTTNALTPTELHDLIAVHESSLKDQKTLNLKSNIKQLREIILYSLHENSYLVNLPDYQKLSNEIENFCNLVAELSGTKDISIDQVDILNKSTLELNSKIKLISTKQVRR